MNISRRSLLGSLALTAAAQPPNQKTMIGVPFERHEKLRMGVIGTGGRGTGVMANFLATDVEVKALCDVIPARAERAKARVEKAGQKAPELYTNGERDFERLCAREDLDLVLIATPWKWHAPMAISAMKHGHHAAVEVPVATTIEDCWALVNTSEQTRRHCIMLENCCYGETELLVLNMVRAGLFGDLTHGAAAYNHDLRSILFGKQGEGEWRRDDHTRRDGNLYPTHGLGPVANYMAIHRGDRFVSMVSMSSAPLSLAAYRDRTLPPDDPRRKEIYKAGDQNTSLIKTAKGRLIRLEHNVSSPMPYDRINLIAGTQGIFVDYPPRIYIEGNTKTADEYESIDRFKDQFTHPLWRKAGELAKKMGGHGGMDFIEAYRLVECMRQGLVPDIDVYDSAAWSAPSPLSEQSLQKNSSSVEFPDFTRGLWSKTRA